MPQIDFQLSTQLLVLFFSEHILFFGLKVLLPSYKKSKIPPETKEFNFPLQYTINVFKVNNASLNGLFNIIISIKECNSILESCFSGIFSQCFFVLFFNCVYHHWHNLLNWIIIIPVNLSPQHIYHFNDKDPHSVQGLDVNSLTLKVPLRNVYLYWYTFIYYHIRCTALKATIQNCQLTWMP